MDAPRETDLRQTLATVLSSLDAGTVPTDAHGVIDRTLDALKHAEMTQHQVFSELASLAKFIADAKKDIAGIRPDAIASEHIPDVTDQLDAVVGATEEATNKIMDSCDTITKMAGEQPEPMKATMMAEVSKIYEACNFQDLTGQRITKVVRTLKHIDGQVASLLEALKKAGFDLEFDGTAQNINISKATDTEKHLLNGPQMADQAINQDDIDKLFD
jgi:chemotaxis protein CheZ